MRSRSGHARRARAELLASATAQPEAVGRLVDWLGEVGARWGLPAEACRIHGWLYLNGRAATASELAAATGHGPDQTEGALEWLADHGLAEPDGDNFWRTGDDPWELVMRALERRRDRELGPALSLLRQTRGETSDPALRERIARLLRLVEDIEALDAQARRFSSSTLRRLIGVGGTAARTFDRLLGGKGGDRR